MEKHKSLKSVFFFFLIILIISCSAGKKSSVKDVPLPAKAILVTVKDYTDLDGCTFLLENPDGKKFQPTNLPDDLKQDNIKIFITYKSVQGFSVCMAGEMIELTFTQKQK